MACPGWRISERSDGYLAVERCDECARFADDEEAALDAQAAGVRCFSSYPCHVFDDQWAPIRWDDKEA